MPESLLMTCEKGTEIFSLLGEKRFNHHGYLYANLDLNSISAHDDLLLKLQNESKLGLSFGLKTKNYLPKAIFCDVDSTLIPLESIEAIAKLNGYSKKVAYLTKEAMEGRLDFKSALIKRLELLKGINMSEIITLANQVSPHDGAKTLINWCKEKKIPFYLVSGGFEQMLEIWAEKWGATDFHGNILETEQDKLSGKIKGKILDGAGKKSWMEKICREMKISTEDALALGDGANDLHMIKQAGLGGGFNPKEILLPHLKFANFTNSHDFLYRFLSFK